jgi:PKD repeat protein
VVTVNTPPIADFTCPDIACTSQAVTFDASGSIDNEQSQITYHWDFGDGTNGEGAQVTKAFEQGGRYNVLLSVNDNANTSCSTDSIGKVISINTKPTANAGDDVDLCLQHNQDYDVSFNGSRSVDEDNDTLTYRWDFGDGTSSEGANVTHLYQNKGEYVATLFVDDGTGTACSSSSDAVHVKLNKAPVADAGPNHVCCLDTVSEFDGSQSYGADGDNLTYTWDFGDGATGDGAQVTHVYTTIGKYLVTLTVNDNSGTRCDTATDSFTAVVNATPTSIIKIR